MTMSTVMRRILFDRLVRSLPNGFQRSDCLGLFRRRELCRSLCIVLNLFLIGGLQAQRTIRVLHYGAPQDAQLKEVFFYGGHQDIRKVHRVELSSWIISEPIAIMSATQSLSILDRPLNIKEGIPKSSVQVDLSDGWADTLILLCHAPESSPLPLKVQKINLSKEVFAEGGILWLNLSNVHLQGTVGGEKLSLKARDKKVMQSPSKKSIYPVKVELIPPGTKRPRGLINQMWTYTEGKRSLVFITPQDPPRYAHYKAFPIFDPPPTIKK